MKKNNKLKGIIMFMMIVFMMFCLPVSMISSQNYLFAESSDGVYIYDDDGNIIGQVENNDETNNGSQNPNIQSGGGNSQGNSNKGQKELSTSEVEREEKNKVVKTIVIVSASVVAVAGVGTIVVLLLNKRKINGKF